MLQLRLTFPFLFFFSKSKFCQIFFLVVNLINQATKKETVLVLNGRGGWKSAMLVNSAGGQEELNCFERDDNTQAYLSCSINWKNELFIFGGSTEKGQISRLSGYKLERIGDLSFDHYYGACSAMGNQLIFVCFDMNDGKRCRRSTGPLEPFSEIALSTYDHLRIQTSCSDSKFIFSTRNS